MESPRTAVDLEKELTCSVSIYYLFLSGGHICHLLQNDR